MLNWKNSKKNRKDDCLIFFSSLVRFKIFGEELDFQTEQIKNFFKNNFVLISSNSGEIVFSIHHQQSSKSGSSSVSESEFVKKLNQTDFNILKQNKFVLKFEIFNEKTKNSSSAEKKEMMKKHIIRAAIAVFGLACFVYLFHFIVVVCFGEENNEEQSDSRSRVQARDLGDLLERSTVKRKLGEDHGRFNDNM